jgi:hypothetical protein
MDINLISGGSSGADTGALMAGKQLHINNIGFIHNNCPDFIKELYRKCTVAKNHTDKDISNVDIADVLIAFRINKPKTGKGTEMTVNYAKTGSYKHVPIDTTENVIEIIGNKPVLILFDLGINNMKDYAMQIVKFLTKHKPTNIMISGPSKETFDCDELVRDLLVLSLNSWKVV